MIKGIDISHWNEAIDFDRVKASGVEFVIIKAG
jgi:GH25 family lysozyme M1 (1,4-beta-N-acetylmuramidase)